MTPTLVVKTPATTYVYDFTSVVGNTTIDAAELTLVGIVDHGTTALVAGDLNA